MEVTIIKGQHGEWQAHIFDGDPDKMLIKFFPHYRADGCSDIRLSQTVTVRAFDRNGSVIGGTFGGICKDPAASPCLHFDDDSVTGADGYPVVIDHKKCEGDPYYNGNDIPQDKSLPGDATSTPPESTELGDAPNTGFADKNARIAKITKLFETCAICTHTGEILGCIKWKSEATPSDGGDVSLGGANEQPASNDFKNAFREFVENHTGVKVEGGKAVLRWFCPDTSKDIKGPGGKTDDPWGGPVPDGFRSLWLRVKEVTEWYAMELHFERGATGGGSRVALDEALKRAQAAPERSAVKFTWAGDQTKSTPSVILTGYHALSAKDVAPFVYDESGFANDFGSTVVYFLSPDQQQKLVSLLSERGRKLAASHGPVMVALLVDVGGPSASAAVGQLAPTDVREIVVPLAAHEGTTDEILRGLAYLGENFGFAQ